MGPTKSLTFSPGDLRVAMVACRTAFACDRDEARHLLVPYLSDIVGEPQVSHRWCPNKHTRRFEVGISDPNKWS